MMLLVCIFVAAFLCIAITASLDAFEGWLEDWHRKPFVKIYGPVEEDDEPPYGTEDDPMSYQEFMDFWCMLSEDSKRNYTAAA